MIRAEHSDRRSSFNWEHSLARKIIKSARWDALYGTQLQRDQVKMWINGAPDPVWDFATCCELAGTSMSMVRRELEMKLELRKGYEGRLDSNTIVNNALNTLKR